MNCLPPSYDSTSYVLSRFESEPIAEFLAATLERDHAWGNADRDLRFAREEAAWSRASSMSATQRYGDNLAVDDVMDRLYGPRARDRWDRGQRRVPEECQDD